MSAAGLRALHVPGEPLVLPYLAAGADCLYPIGIADERDIAAFTALGAPVNVLLRPGTPSPARLAELGVARISLAEGLHAHAMDAVRARLDELRAGWPGQPPR